MLCMLTSRAQVVSQFNWNSNPVTTAVVGPNAISVGATAVSSSGGVGGTNGLNPGAPTANDISLTVPNTSSVLDVPNIDISIYYRRNESTASMVRRGTFNFNTGNAAANFQVTFRVNNGSGGTTVTSTVYPIPADATFRQYRFTYDNCSGVGTMYVNNVVVWASPTPTPNQNLYWVGDGNLVIGGDMDGANNNVPNLDEFVMQTYTCSSLPITLSSFTVYGEGKKNRLSWTTETEHNNAYFNIERSVNGTLWTAIARVDGAGNSQLQQSYQAVDEAPNPGINYYRLRQTDRNGQSVLFGIVAADNQNNASKRLLRVTDLLGRDLDATSEELRLLHYSDGSVVKRIGK